MKMVHPIGNNKICPIDNNRTHDGRKSQNIPLPESHVHRTQSEVQLCQDMESAEQRDLNMFYRLVNGIRDRQMHLVRDNESSNAAAAYYDPAHGLTEAEQSLARIIHTRNAPVATVPSPKNISINNNNNNRYNHANRHSSGLNTGIPIFEVKNEEQQQQPQEGPASAALASLVGNHRLQQNEWSFSGFDDSSTSLSPEQRESQYIHQQQQQQQQQHNQFSSNQSTATASSPSCTAQHFATAAALAVATSSIPHTLQQQYHNFSSASMTDGGDMDEGIFDFDL